MDAGPQDAGAGSVLVLTLAAHWFRAHAVGSRQVVHERLWQGQSPPKNASETYQICQRTSGTTLHAGF